MLVFLGSGNGDFECAAGHDRAEVFAVRGGAAHIGDGYGGGLSDLRGGFKGRGRDRLADERVARGGDKQGRGRDRRKSDAGGDEDAIGDRDRDPGANDGDIHFIPRNETEVGCARVRRGRGDLNRNEKFAGGELVAARCRAEIFNGDGPATAWPGDARGGSEGNKQRDGVGAGRGVTEVPPEGSPALDLGPADPRSNFGEGRKIRLDNGVRGEAVTGDRGTDDEPGDGVEVERVEFRDLLDVDDVIGFFATGTELHDKVRTAGEEPGGGLTHEQTDGFRERRGSGIVEGFHIV